MVVEGSGQPGQRVALAVDIGGTKLVVGVVDEGARVLWSTRCPTPGADGELMYSTVASMLDEAIAAAPARPVVCGVGCGGPMEPRGRTVSPLNITGWRGFPLLQRLESDLGLPVAIDNDAKALALAEGWVGAAIGERNFMAMVVSTGVGGGIVLDGRLLDGAQGNAGHIGHLVVNPGGRVHAGIAGTVEGEASGTALADHLGAPADTADLAWRERTGQLVGRAVGGVANLLDLRLVVVAGSVALGFGDDFFGPAQREVGAVAKLDHSLGTRIVPAGLGSDGPLIGAAAVGRRGEGMMVGNIEPPLVARRVD